MSEADISPLAKRLAEENNVDWRKLSGSGADGKVVERDVLEYLARVMSGQEDLDPTPEPLPDGMESWPDEDIAAYRRGARERAAAEADPVPTPPSDDEGIDEDIFLFEDEASVAAAPAEAEEGGDVFAVSGGVEIEEDEDLFLDLSGDDEPEGHRDAEASGDRAAYDLDAMSFDLDEPEPPAGGGAAVERADVRDLAFVGGEGDEEEDEPFTKDAPLAGRERAEHRADEPEPRDPEPAPRETVSRQTVPRETAPAHVVTRTERESPATAQGLPIVSYGSLFRRHVDLTAVENAQAALGREIGREDPLALATFLVRAAGKALQVHPLGEGGVALATVEGGLGYVSVPDPAERSFRELVEHLERVEPKAELEGAFALVVADLSMLEIDEAVLNLGAPVLALGRVLYDDEAGGVRGTLSLSGEVSAEAGGRLLATVADLLAAPVRLLI